MAPGVDAGNILYQRRSPIGPHDTVGDLYAKLNAIQRSVLADTVAAHLAGHQGETAGRDGRDVWMHPRPGRR